MFKENFKAAFGFVTGIYAGLLAVEAIGNLLGKDSKKKDDAKPEVKTEAEAE